MGGLVSRRGSGVAQQHRQTIRIRVHDGLVRSGGIVERELMGDQRLNLHTSGGNQAQEFFHVAVFGPTYIGQGIILTLLFVYGIVTAWTISARHEELNFLAVHVIPREAQLNRADIHDASAITTDINRKLAGSSRLGRRSNDHAIDALATGQSTDILADLRATGHSGIGT